jgi:hypothetical protein
VAPTVELSAIQISVGAFRQKAGRVAAGIVVVRAGRKSVQQSELPAGRDFENRPPADSTLLPGSLRLRRKSCRPTPG